MTNEIHNSCNQFFILRFLSALHVSNEFSRSSSGAQYNVPIVLCNTVHYLVLLMMND